MQITDFKQCGTEINITRREDYKNTFTQMGSACTLRLGFKVLIKSISYNRQSDLFLHFLSTSKLFQ